jgi:purine-binding chemotaxis protein CheW
VPTSPQGSVPPSVVATAESHEPDCCMDSKPDNRQRRDTAVTATGAQFVGFEVAGQRYIFRIERIQEIVIPTALTRIPEVPFYVEGVTNLRGTIIPIVNLRLLFGLEPKPTDPETRTVVVNVGPRTIGCTVDSVSRVMRVAADQIQHAPEGVATGGRRYVEGFARVGDDLFILLDVDQLLDPAHLEDVHRTGGIHGHPPAATVESSIPSGAA